MKEPAFLITAKGQSRSDPSTRLQQDAETLTETCLRPEREITTWGGGGESEAAQL